MYFEKTYRACEPFLAVPLPKVLGKYVENIPQLTLRLHMRGRATLRLVVLVVYGTREGKRAALEEYALQQAEGPARAMHHFNVDIGVQFLTIVNPVCVGLVVTAGADTPLGVALAIAAARVESIGDIG